MSNCHQITIIRLLGSSLQIQSVFLDFLKKKKKLKKNFLHKGMDPITRNARSAFIFEKAYRKCCKHLFVT